MGSSSRIPGFYKLPPGERRGAIEEHADLHTDEVKALTGDALSLEHADAMIENVIGTFALPLGVGMNFLINGAETVVPMVVEEPSVVAAVSNMARLVRQSGGFTTSADRGVMIGQIQLVEVSDPQRVKAALRAELDFLRSKVVGIHPRLEERGGGLVDVEVRSLSYCEHGQPVEHMVVVHVLLDCVDAMGANLVNTVVERLAPEVARISGERVGLRILSNLADRRLARASCAIPASLFDGPEVDGNEVALGIASAYRFAWADPWRAATHNKGVMNGIDAVAIATGNDWRAIEAGAHAWAARDGAYRSLTRWTVQLGPGGDKVLHGFIELPIQAGTVGGTTLNHPTVASNMKILGNPSARELAGVMAAVGLAQNLGALRALATEGIQKGHMRMHARAVAAQAGAHPEEFEEVVTELVREQDFSLECALKVLNRLRA